MDSTWRFFWNLCVSRKRFLAGDRRVDAGRGGGVGLWLGAATGVVCVQHRCDLVVLDGALLFSGLGRSAFGRAFEAPTCRNGARRGFVFAQPAFDSLGAIYRRECGHGLDPHSYAHVLCGEPNRHALGHGRVCPCRNPVGPPSNPSRCFEPRHAERFGPFRFAGGRHAYFCAVVVRKNPPAAHTAPLAWTTPHDF